MEARVELGGSGLRSTVGASLWGRGHSPARRAESDGGLARAPPPGWERCRGLGSMGLNPELGHQPRRW